MRGRDETGAATLLALVMVAVLAACALVGVGVGQLLVGERRAATAADLAALAGAQALRDGGGAVVDGLAACAEARRVALANEVSPRSCHVSGGEVAVETAVEVRLWPGLSRTVSGRARAGPANPSVAPGR